MSQPALRNKMRLWRAQNGLTIDEVAGLTGLSKAYISRIERGERCPTPLTRVAIARRLGCGVADLFDVEPVPEGAL